MRIRSVWIVPVAVAVSLIALALPLVPALYDHYLRLPNEARGLLGMPETTVVERLGPPRFRYTREQLGGVSLSESGKPYGGDWSPRPEWPVEHLVLVYTRGAKAAFIYIGRDVKVDAVQIAAT